MLNNRKEECYEFKILYFFAIIMVISIHCNNGGVNLFYDWFKPDNFILAIFCFASGYFFVKNYKRKVITIVWNKIKKLIIPFFAWNLFYGILTYFLRNIGIINYGGKISFVNFFIKPIYDGRQFGLNLSSWFIVPFFMVQMFSMLFIPMLKKKHGIFFVSFIYLVLGMLGIKLNMLGYNTGWWLALTRVLYFLPFFALGILYKEKLEKYDVASNIKYFSVVLGLQLCLIMLYNGNTPSYKPVSGMNFDNILIPFIFGFLGIAFWFRISKILVPILKKSKIVNLISENTFTIMMHHLLGFFVLNLFLIGFSKYFLVLKDFDIEKFLTSVYCIYSPKGVPQFKLIYIIVGVGFPLIIAFIQNRVKYWLMKIIEKSKRRKLNEVKYVDI